MLRRDSHQRQSDRVQPLKNIQNKLHALDPETYPRTAVIAYAMDPKELETVLDNASAQRQPAQSVLSLSSRSRCLLLRRGQSLRQPIRRADISQHGADRRLDLSARGETSYAPSRGPRNKKISSKCRSKEFNADAGAARPHRRCSGLVDSLSRMGRPRAANRSCSSMVFSISLIAGSRLLTKCWQKRNLHCASSRRIAAATATAAGLAPAATIISPITFSISTAFSAPRQSVSSNSSAIPWAAQSRSFTPARFPIG